MISNRETYSKILIILLLMPFIWGFNNLEQWIAFKNMLPNEILQKGGFFVKQLEPVIHLGFANLMRNILLLSAMLFFLIEIYVVFAKSNIRFSIFMIFNFIMLISASITIFNSISDFAYYPGLFTSIFLIIPYSIYSTLFFVKSNIFNWNKVLKIQLVLSIILYFPITALIWYLGAEITKIMIK